MGCIKERNLDFCSCSATDCPRHGVCCECVKHHRESGEIPGCFFNADVEKTFDRSVENFIKSNTNS